ncbi:MAG: UDP-3-O-(3-hydroxymyristoyl)glucosamine N-acyltransferase [Gammaproteobacteria bacterium]|nr:MAG: UDP-3-O-(3-hydroxymyristoyl)glucosamine N-acyltransferase [Gammaproteobacteria bacterium]RLA17576.1 MAG: UDP-3-O-(3-hydroxymyristoyl)glucosamine N-acyltransferase [Gammaproteobacteria bacterium]
MPSLAELARLVGAELDGDGGQLISAVATLKSAQPDEISFFTNRRYRAELAATRAAAVILAPPDRALFSGPCLLSGNPYLSFARVSALLNPELAPLPGLHPSASVEPTASLGANVAVDANVTIGAGAVIGANCVISAGAVIAAGVEIGAGCRVGVRAVLMEKTRLGARCCIGEGAVLGSRGFGYASDGARWVPVPQLGGVWLGDDVDVGANTTIDRGALEDTVLERGAKLDNQIQVAHGVVIGEDTAIAACVGISGSTRIGKRCTIAGGVGFVGHLDIADGVHITGMSMVTRSIKEAGVYSGYPTDTNDNWRKNTARFHKLDHLARKVAVLERALKNNINSGE